MSTKPTNTTPEKKDQKTGVLKKYLDNTFGDEGLRTDVKITVTNETLYKLIAAGVAMSVTMTVAHLMTKKLFEKLLAS